MHVRSFEAFFQFGKHCRYILFIKTGLHENICLHFLHIRTFFPSFCNWYPTRRPRPQVEQNNNTFEALRGALYLTTCPFSPWRFGLTFFTRRFNPSMTTFPAFGITSSTFPFFPLSLPETNITVSPFLNAKYFITLLAQVK